MADESVPREAASGLPGLECGKSSVIQTSFVPPGRRSSSRRSLTQRELSRRGSQP